MCLQCTEGLQGVNNLLSLTEAEWGLPESLSYLVDIVYLIVSQKISFSVWSLQVTLFSISLFLNPTRPLTVLPAQCHLFLYKKYYGVGPKLTSLVWEPDNIRFWWIHFPFAYLRIIWRRNRSRRAWQLGNLGRRRRLVWVNNSIVSAVSISITTFQHLMQKIKHV